MKTPSTPRPKFSLGQIVATAQAMATITKEDIQLALERHVKGDWGEVGIEDGEANEQALLDGERLLSVYEASGGETFWIITEADRSSTTVLLPSDY